MLLAKETDEKIKQESLNKKQKGKQLLNEYSKRPSYTTLWINEGVSFQLPFADYNSKW